MDSSITRLALLLMAIPALLLAQTDADRLPHLNRQADPLIATYDLDKAERRSQSSQPPGQPLPRHAKRDGHHWRNLAIPHLLRLSLQFVTFNLAN